MKALQSTILVLDDEKQIRKFLRISLNTAGYKVEEAENGASAVRLVNSIKPDLVICDLGLPDIDGTDVIQQIREYSQVPILVLSVRSDDSDIVQALDLGADDYLIKPFSVEVLLARIKANLRKGLRDEGGEPIMQVRDLTMDVFKHEVTLAGEKLSLSPKEFTLLKYLMMHKGKVVMHSQLLTELWGRAHEENIQYLRIYIGQLRQKIEIDSSEPHYILTEPGIGYRLADE